MKTLVVANQRILPHVAATLEVQWRDAHGEPVAAAEPVTVTVTRADGTALLTDAAASPSTDGFDAGTWYTATLPAAQNQHLDLLTAVWTDDDGNELTTTVAVVGGVYVTGREVRQSDQTLLDLNRYPDVEIRRRRLGWGQRQSQQQNASKKPIERRVPDHQEPPPLP